MNNRRNGVLISYICIFIKMIAGLLYVPILLGYLSDAEYGLYQLMGSLISYLAVMDFGLSATVIRYYTVYRSTKDLLEAENVLGIARRIYSVICIAAFSICIIIFFVIDSIFGKSLSGSELIEAKQIFIVLSANMILTLFANVYIAILNSHEKFILLKSLDILNSLFQLCFVFIAMNISRTALSVVIMLFLINLFTVIVKVYYSRFRLGVRVKYHHRDNKLVKSMLTFSVSVFIVSIVDMIYWKTDQVILGAVSGTVAVAVYGVASQIYWNYMPLSTAIQSVFLPSITEKIANGVDDKEISNIFINIGRIQFLVLGCVLSGFVLVGRQFITIIAGANYLDAYWICIIIMIPFTIDLIQNMGINIMQAKNQYGFRALMYSLAAVGNIVLTLLLAKRYEGIGCAIASAICMIISNGIIMNWYYYKKQKINIPLFWKTIAKIAMLDAIIVSLLLVAFRFISIPNIIIEFIIKLFVFVILYVIVIYRFVLKDDEKKKIWIIIKKVKRR